MSAKKDKSQKTLFYGKKTGRNLMQTVIFINKYILGVGVPILLVVLGIFFCVRLRFFHFLHPIKVIKSFFPEKRNEWASSLRAVTLALAGTLGVGNMVGVASAIVLGGFGAVFWMWVSAFVAMILKYAEIVLAMCHRRFDMDGKPYGGAVYYISACFKRKKVGVVLSYVFAVFCILNSLSMGSMIQVNAAARALEGTFNVPCVVIGVIFAFITFCVMLKGSHGVLSVTDKLVPIMTLGFTVLSVAVIIMRPSDALGAIILIFEDAFELKSGIGGVFGFLLSNSLRYGTMRGILSNEAGCGTAPAAHAVSNCDIPAKQGMFGILEVFVDTILLCTLTAIVIIVGSGGVVPSGSNYMMITVNAYSDILGKIAGDFIAISVILFGLATVLCWGYYGLESVNYLCKGGRISLIFVLLYAASLIYGAIMTSEIAWEIADLSIGVMSIINLSVLFFMNSQVVQETKNYFNGKG